MNSALEQDDAEHYSPAHSEVARTSASPHVVERKPDVDAAALDALLRKAFGADVPLSSQRTLGGLCTQVYRVRRGGDLYYLRVAEAEDENLETDAEVFERLSALGVKVPDVVFVEPFDEALRRSVMITTVVRGVPLEQVSSRTAATSVLHAAGTDLARLNKLPVEGFGWIRRSGRGPLRADLHSYADLVSEGLPQSWPGMLATAFDTPTLDRLEVMVDEERGREVVSAGLAHGDFKPTHIFTQRGSYTGLIDFGEIRGTDVLFDLGFFHLRVEEADGTPLLSAVLDGYREVRALPADHEEAIWRSAVVHGLAELCGWLRPERRIGRDHPVAAARISRINDLMHST